MRGTYVNFQLEIQPGCTVFAQVHVGLQTPLRIVGNMMLNLDIKRKDTYVMMLSCESIEK